MKPFLGICVFIFIATVAFAADLTVDEAYLAIPHQQTAFDKMDSSLATEEKDFLDDLFHLTDQAMAERVSLLKSLSSGGAPEMEDYGAILTGLNALTVPDKLRPAHKLIVEAIVEQRQALTDWKEKGIPLDWKSDPRVHSSSDKLKQAYGLLSQLYPQENPHNRQAFFDYLCALDFL